ncbi:hypothetical protein [Bradyrhizobium japonicum]|uniref:hypothetical protein n=1 Tax=Bradyrhizobium japonicum TaxID=375 RepID=UPI002B48D861|nr:hypothetical protein [Bradyrhizobium japonicum]WRI91745.1 hypothetical protein R3F75_12790 [Bradyrhizobium japonicum]
MVVLDLGRKVVGALRDHPLALALVVINLLFLTGFGFMLREIARAVARKDALLADIASHCLR